MGLPRFLPAVVAVVLLSPASAFAASGSLTNCDQSNVNCTMNYSAAGEANQAVVSVFTDPNTQQQYFSVVDPRTTITAQTPCLDSSDGAPNDNTMICPQNLVGRVSAGLGDGNDTITVEANIPTELRGGNGSDSMTGGPAGDTIYGDNPDGTGAGDDFIEGGQGNDTQFGGAGNDTFVAEAGGDGTDDLHGGDGTDTATYSARTQPLQLSIDGVANDGFQGSATDNIETDVEDVVGGSAGDSISGSVADNSLGGGGGDDSLSGGGGNDTLSGDTGNDNEQGGDGNDTEHGGAGDDSLTGDAGADGLDGGDGNDTLNGGADGDRLTGDAGSDHIDGGDGNDIADGGDGNDTELGGEGSDSLDGGAGDDSLDGGSGPDTLVGGDGTDLADYASRTSPVTVTLDGKAGDGEFLEFDNVEPDVENVHGGSGPDTLIGDAASNSFDGGAGENYEDGGGGADNLVGGSSGDVFRTRGSTAGATITCGPGPDFVVAKPTDNVSPDCDRVDRGVNQKPKLRDSAVVAPVGGLLQMSPAGIVRRVPLQDKVVLPLSSIVDTTTGSVKVTSAATKRATQTVKLEKGAFDLTQERGKTPFTQFALQGGDFTLCGAAARWRVAVTAARKTIVRQLWATGKGKFRTRGRYAAATIRGTKWKTVDRCDGTLISVVSGAVSVRDLRKKKTVVVTVGHSYLAKR